MNADQIHNENEDYFNRIRTNEYHHLRIKQMSEVAEDESFLFFEKQIKSIEAIIKKNGCLKMMKNNRNKYRLQLQTQGAKSFMNEFKMFKMFTFLRKYAKRFKTARIESQILYDRSLFIMQRDYFHSWKGLITKNRKALTHRKTSLYVYFFRTVMTDLSLRVKRINCEQYLIKKNYHQFIYFLKQQSQQSIKIEKKTQKQYETKIMYKCFKEWIKVKYLLYQQNLKVKKYLLAQLYRKNRIYKQYFNLLCKNGMNHNKTMN